ncbi:hypothetical protein AAFF_G00161380 [Aldrovandia affinis]|uniref:Uncharacterized protein n=1 Tax=Aldrovandia affinis TaxID=143900 RepID=A0AAD7RQ50_9TELE|nr:hypothetical protein AAFF_G00161380 [Aldrovandia affinis]
MRGFPWEDRTSAASAPAHRRRQQSRWNGRAVRRVIRDTEHKQGHVDNNRRGREQRSFSCLSEMRGPHKRSAQRDCPSLGTSSSSSPGHGESGERSGPTQWDLRGRVSAKRQLISPGTKADTAALLHLRGQFSARRSLNERGHARTGVGWRKSRPAPQRSAVKDNRALGGPACLMEGSDSRWASTSPVQTIRPCRAQLSALLGRVSRQPPKRSAGRERGGAEPSANWVTDTAFSPTSVRLKQGVRNDSSQRPVGSVPRSEPFSHSQAQCHESDPRTNKDLLALWGRDSSSRPAAGDRATVSAATQRRGSALL